MSLNIIFFINSILLGTGLAMDAFSISLANALNEPGMKKSSMLKIAGVFGIFQFTMPLIGWICIHTIVIFFSNFHKIIPWIALIILLYIGTKMIIESLKKNDVEKSDDKTVLSFSTLLLQGIATSIDALSAGFTIADYSLSTAVLSSLIIGAVTFAICLFGLLIGRKAGSHIGKNASIIGGIILIGIGIEIFIKGVFYAG
ncbi:MAG: manganese efflux pump [Treponema sp.]|nr:manganese efflux pump [Treponema sp.]